ncbi:hypothetical protein TNCV_3148871 [Trichonephila clavipes]|nr:hypothetical protein TNCV_3148871 [Trichonephila clavipes]
MQAFLHCAIQVPNVTFWYGVPCVLYLLCHYWDGQCWLWMVLEISYITYVPISHTFSIGDRSGDLIGQNNIATLCRARCVKQWCEEERYAV